MKNFLPFIFSLLSFHFLSAQTTYDFSSGATISGGPAGFGIWNTQADITIDGVAYTITSGGNGSLTVPGTGGAGNSACLMKEGSGGDQFTLRRADGQPFQFYGIWVKHQSMNSYAQFMSLPPFYTVTYNTADEDDEDPTYTDATAMQSGSLTTSATSITNNITVTSVTIGFNAIMYYWIDNINVGPAPNATPAPSISAQPANKTVCASGNTSFSLTASNATGYQWQVNSGSGFTNVGNGGVYSGATTATLTISGATAAMNNYQYRCVLAGTSPVNSNSATLTVRTITVATSQTNVRCTGGNTGAASVFVTGGGIAPYSYSWSPSGGTSPTASGLYAGTYHVNISDASSCSTSKTFNITEPPPAPLSFSSQPADKTADANANASFTATALNASSLQWQVNTGSEFTNVGDGGIYSGATTATLTITGATAAMNGYLYRCLATSNCSPSITSNSAKLTTKSSNAFLSALQVNTGSLSPEFSSEGFMYNVEVSAGTSSIVFTPTTSDSKATVKVNGLDLEDGSSTVALEGGDNRITVTTTAEDGTTTLEYTVKIFRPSVSVVSLTRTANQYTNGETASYTLKLNGAVNNLSAENLSVSAANTLSGYSITSVTQTAPDTYSIVVNTGSGDGLLNVNVENATGLSAPVDGLPFEGAEAYIVDKTNPVALARNIAITLGLNGQYTIVPSSVNNESHDNLSTEESLNYSLNKSIFTNADLGENTVILTVTDQAGNKGETQATVTVRKNINRITAIQAVNIVYGQIPSLPETAEVTYPDLTKQNIPVSWNMSGYTGKAGEFVLTGKLDSVAYITNSEALSAHITVQVSRKPLNVTLTGTVEKVYDGTTTATLSESNFQSDKLAVDFITFSATASYDTKNAGTAKNISVAEINISGEDAENYSLADETANAQIGSITARDLEITLKGRIEKMYDGRKTATLSANNFSSNALEEDDLTFNAYAEYDNKNAGEDKTITASDFFVSGEDAGNYSVITDIAQTHGDIFRKDITASANALPLITKTYDGSAEATLAAGNYNLEGIVEGDDVNITGEAGYENRMVGTDKNITVNALELSGASKNNYHLTTVSVTTTGDITGKSLQPSFKSEALVSKTYDGNKEAVINPDLISVEGIVGEDEVYLNVPAAGSYDDQHAGSNKNVAVIGLTLSGGDALNYTLASGSVNGNVGKITPKEVAVSADAKTKVYGASDPAFTYHATGLVGNDRLSGSLTREDGRNVGNYAISRGTVNGGNDYTISEFSAGNLSITPASLVIKAEDKNKQQGTANPVLTLVYSGFVAGDSPASLSSMPVTNTVAGDRSPIGYYDIVASGAASANYNISYEKGQLSILPSADKAGSLQAWSAAPGTLEVRIYAETEQDATITLYTALGQPIVIHKRHLYSGVNKFTMPGRSLASSTYVLSVWAKKFRLGERVQVK